MSETSAGGKTKSTEKNEKSTTSKSTTGGSENSRSNLNETTSSITDKMLAIEAKVRPPDRKSSPKRITRNTNIKPGREKVRREDDRRPTGPSSGRGRRSDGTYPRGGSAVSHGHMGSLTGSPTPQSNTRESSSQLERKSQDSGKAFLDESKLSKLMRRIFSSADRERRLTAARTLKDFILSPEGNKACSKEAHDILGTLQNVFFERGFKEVKAEVASCVGIVGSTMGPDMHSYFDWIFTQVGGTMVDDEVKICFLQALLETLKHNEKKHCSSDLVMKLMANMQSLLEGADTPDLLVAVIDVILYIARVYPHIFSAHFRNTVDILVGWHIDPSQRESLISYMSQALISFKQFWSSDITFSTTLLTHFLEDMDAYAEDLNLSATGQRVRKEKLLTPEEYTVRMGSLLRVFTTVVESLGDNLSPVKGGSIPKEFSCKLLEKIIVSIETAMKYVFIESVLVAANNCICVLLSQLGADAVACGESLLPYVAMQAFSNRLSSRQLLLTFFKLTQKVVEAFGTQLPVDFLARLFETDSLLLTTRFSHSSEVLNQLMTVYHTVMVLKSVPLLEETYRLVLADLEVGLRTLHGGDRVSPILVPDNPYHSVKYSVKQAETIILFNLWALSEIANTKSNLIGMWALFPSIFDLLSEQLEPGDPWMAGCHPSVQYAVVHTLYGHCSRHGHFVSSSSLLTPANPDTASLATMSQATKGHLSRIMSLLVTLLEEPRTSFDVKSLAMKWVSEIVNGLLTSPHVFLLQPCLAMVKAVIAQGYDREPQMITAAGQSLLTLFKSGMQFPSHITQECLELCAFRLTDLRKSVKELYFSLLKGLHLDIVTSRNTAFESEEEALARQRSDRNVGLKMGWIARRNHQCFPSAGLFHPHNYRHIISYMLNNMPPSQFGGLNWLEAMFFNCQSSVKETERSQDSVLLSDLDTTESLLWFWASFEAAQFTVQSRLRTQLGKPQETFMTIEGILKAFATEAKNSAEMEDTACAGDSIRSDKAGEYHSLQRVHILLQFMEHLEKLLYNAYEGCAVAMTSPNKIVRTFFRTNRNTCLEWLARIRLCVMTIAAHAGMPAVVIRHAHEMLNDLVDVDNTQGSEFEQVVVFLVKALCDLHCHEAVLGLYSWCRQVTAKKFSWVKVAAEKASRKYEQAAKEYKTVLRGMLAIDGTEGKDLSESNESSPEHRMNQKMESGEGTKQRLAQKFTQPNPNTINFLTSEVTESYLKLNDWKSVLEWQEMLTQWRSDASLTALQQAFNSSIDINYVKAMAYFEDRNFEKVRSSLELIPGASLTDTSKGDHCVSTWNPQAELSFIHKQFLRTATLLQDQRQTNHKAEVLRYLNYAERTGEGLLRVAAFEWPPLLPSEVVTEVTIVSTLRKQLEERKGKTCLLPLSSRLWAREDQDLSSYLRAMHLVHLQIHLPAFDKKTDLTAQLSSLQVAAATLARKQTNYELAENLLVRQIAFLSTADQDSQVKQQNLIPSLTSLLQCRDSIELLDVMRVEREASKLLHALSQPVQAMDIISSSVASCLAVTEKAATENGTFRKRKDACGELCSRSLLTLVKWVQADSKLLAALGADSQLTRFAGTNFSHTDSVLSNIKLLLESEAHGVAQKRGLLLEDGDESWLEGSSNMSEGERVVGRLLHLSTMESPGLAKAWFILAGWCYKWGRKAVDNASHGSVELSPDEKSSVLATLPQGTNAEEIQRVMGILSQIHDLGTSEEDISDQDQSLYDDGTEMTRKQLLMGGDCLRVAPEGCLDQLLEIWKSVVRRVYLLYQLSAKAYFLFLQLNDLTEGEENEDGNIIATLRLLRLLVKHAWELQAVLETGLAHTPTAPWKGIIPQLFARLSHPENYVRRSVSELLCRVAQDAPHLIVYPAIVGCTSAKIVSKVAEESRFLNTYLSQEEAEGEDLDTEEPGSQDEEEEENSGDDSNNTMLQSCLAAIVDTLSQHNPRMISEVQGMVMELRRVTLLWEELWLGTLTQHHGDVQRRLSQLEAEIRKVNTNQGLNRQEKAAIIREKHRTIMKPTLYTMERLQEITSRPPETPHEVWFQTTFGEMIKNALERLRNPTNPSHPHASWHLFKQMYITLQQRAQKRGSLHLKMEEISPKLAVLAHSLIPMPGLGLAGQTVTIEKVCNTVQILPTKTKPKKMVFLGSDGKRHSYLFKGLEDLHLDERIMQFLSIVNNMFTSASRGEGSKTDFRARHYSVTPLGPRSGLIQWVEGATPLFGLYKKWQQREAYAQTLKHGNATSQSNTTNQPTISRPSDVFYSKLNPVLKEKGIETTDNRKEWPLSILRKVLEDLMDDTPDDLLAKELWCASAGAGEWWRMTQTYSRSTAVMSMIGYIIGLGDRHLDNVLVDLATGEVVHIDYNVCFEKGKNLRVPERVPFRMTQNIETALGVTGVEGIFRLSSEHVLRTMRKGRETLLTLLEAFVYDPLVDWTTGNEGGYTGAFYGGETGAMMGAGDGVRSKKEMEQEITISMFAIRCAEMNSTWTRNRDDILVTLPDLQNAVGLWIAALDQLHASHQTLDLLQAIRTILAEAAADPSHSLHSLAHRHAEYAVMKTTKQEVLMAMEEKCQEYNHFQQVHKNAIEAVQGVPFQKLCTEISKSPDLGPPSFASATEFLQGAGQSQTVIQCEQVEAEMVAQLKQRHILLHSTLEVLHNYSSVVSQFGVIFANSNRAYHLLNFLQELIQDFTIAKCEEITSRFHDLYSPHVGQSMYSQQVLATERKLQTIVSDTNAKLLKLLDRRSQDSTTVAVHEMSLCEAEAAIQTFLQATGLSGEKSLTCFIISALSSLSKRYLLMETASAGAGDRLMDLTSRDGDWFLDELCSISGNVNHFLDILECNTSAIHIDKFKELHVALRATYNVYVAIQELNLNFRSIILPEALKLIQSQEPSILGAVCQLESFVGESTHSLDSLVNELEVIHRNVVMGVQVDSSQVLEKVQLIQNSYNHLIQGHLHLPVSLLQENQHADLSPGQMLLMGFDGLFTRLDSEFAQLLACVSVLEIPDAWRKVDAIREARTLQLSTWTSDTRSLLSAIFFLKRLQTMQDFFQLATQLAAALQGLNGGAVYDDEQMAKPIKKFIAEYVRKQMIGFPSQLLGCVTCVLVETLGISVGSEVALKDIGAQVKVPLEDLCKKAVETSMRTGLFQHSHLTQATTLTSSQDLGWRKLDLARRLDVSMSLQRASYQRWQGQLARFQWLHEDILSSSSRHQPGMTLPSRGALMSDIKKMMASLLAHEDVINTCKEQYAALEGVVMQRLRWAAGANPSLNVTLQHFQEASSMRTQLLEDENRTVTEVANLCQGILHFEAWRTHTQDSVSADAAFMALISRCMECCMMLESTSTSVSDHELHLLTIQPLLPGQEIDGNWLQTMTDHINTSLAEVTSNISSQQMDLSTCKTKILEQVSNVRSLLSTHHKLISDVRSILKTMAKLEEQGFGEEINPGGIREYLASYKTFSENITTALKAVVSEEATRDSMSSVQSVFADLTCQIPGIYDRLLEFAPPLLQLAREKEDIPQQEFMQMLKRSHDASGSPIRRFSALGQDQGGNAAASSPQTGALHRERTATKKEKVSRDPKTGKAIQERNSYAVGVWRRIKMKLDGRDPDSSKRLSVAEQVDYVIKEARDLDNLCMLYEGWTPWV